MSKTTFTTPVHVLTGLGFVQRIDDAAEAHAFLSALTSNRHALLLSRTRETCRRAMRGEVSSEHARGALIDFCERLSLLMADETMPAKRAA